MMISYDVEVVAARLLYKLIDKICHSSPKKRRFRYYNVIVNSNRKTYRQSIESRSI